MDEHAIRTMLEGGGGPAGSALRALLYLPGKAYGLAMQGRRFAYRRGWLESGTAGVPVISIGNLTAGGSGKTPMTLLLVSLLAQMGRTPGILLRGYRQSEAGGSDEATLYTTLAPGVVVAVDPDRCAGAERAVAAGADVLLMDDGFQHLRLHRNLDIVLVDATAPWGGGNTIPGGLLREPKSTLRHAGMVVVTRSNQISETDLERLVRDIRAVIGDAAPLLRAVHAPARLYSLDGERLPLTALAGRPVVVLSGIARPEAFEKTLAELGANIVQRHALPDHRDIPPETLRAALDEAERAGAVVVTTEKDRAKAVFSEPEEGTTDKNKWKSTDAGRLWIVGVDQRVEDEALLRQTVAALL
ncbi:MAG: tetraacyldisaccharide 4'-kinase [Planctomycetaceae bacterium]|nr:tetraacyldisaccharide 4'-kinase [Planctomycetaceae bacterium]